MIHEGRGVVVHDTGGEGRRGACHRRRDLACHRREGDV